MQLELFKEKEVDLFNDIKQIDLAEILNLDGTKRFPSLEKNRFILFRTGCEDYILKSKGNIFPGVYSKKSGKFLKPRLRGSGSDYRMWMMVQIIKGIRKVFDVECHRLVALAFLKNPDPKNKIIVNHKDNNKSNYLPENLEWVSRGENGLNKNLDKGIMRRREQVLIEKYNA